LFGNYHLIPSASQRKFTAQIRIFQQELAKGVGNTAGIEVEVPVAVGGGKVAIEVGELGLLKTAINPVTATINAAIAEIIAGVVSHHFFWSLSALFCAMGDSFLWVKCDSKKRCNW
jgi:hypothetical protein